MASSKAAPKARAGVLRWVAQLLMSLADRETDSEDKQEFMFRKAKDPGSEALVEDRRAKAFLPEIDIPRWRKLAAGLHTARQKRASSLPEGFFGEAAWDILLDLFVHEGLQKQVSITSACAASGVPPTTALRWLGLLEQQGLVRRIPSKMDARVEYLELTRDGRLSLIASLRRFHELLAPAFDMQGELDCLTHGFMEQQKAIFDAS